ncbi:MAG: substrate-binding domain-containing protein [Proteobacteria bacterium]|nr:substrate-binding domain-containing protein [Pseudomonadota bacterium]MBU0966985.1 substrate-binding domain-containing protein [Pseudomonadota bacterium]
MKNAWLLMASLFLLLGTATNSKSANDGEPGTAKKTLVICGSGDSQNLLRHLAAAYEQSHPNMSIDVPDSIGSGGGVKATAGGKCDLGRVARPLKEKEKELNLDYLLFADSPVIFLVNSSVKGVRSITAQQAVGIFSGAITLWSELGGPHGKIYVANREKGDSSRSVIEKYIPAFNAIDKPVGQTLYTTPENVAAINRYKNTIGYASLAEAGNQPDIVVLQFENVSPDRDNVTKGAYKLVAPLGLVWKNEHGREVKNFIDFLYSPAAEKIMADHGAFSALTKR